jgi:ribosome-associated translation inhibitor RaiA
MAEIDTAINKLISELKKLKGESSGIGDSVGTGGSLNTNEKNKEALAIIDEINKKYDERLNKENSVIQAQREQVKQAK